MFHSHPHQHLLLWVICMAYNWTASRAARAEQLFMAYNNDFPVAGGQVLRRQTAVADDEPHVQENL